MKNILLIIVALCSLQNLSQAQENKKSDPLLTVVLMVKNEAEVIADTLRPFLDAGIDSYVVLDTGSTDDTMLIAQQMFEQYNISHGYIVQQPFVDFSTSRNYAIQCAEEFFPGAQFFIMIDAEWYTYNIDKLLEFCRIHSDSPYKTFGVSYSSGVNQLYMRVLFRAHQGVRYEGVVHEVLNYVSKVRVPDVYIKHIQKPLGYEKSRQRWYRDKDLLSKEHERCPENARTVFYLAQTCACLGELEQACYWYLKRVEMPGWDEENFIACYRLAHMHEQLKEFDKAVYTYLKAYEMRSTRAEPLVKLAQLYLKNNNFHAAFLFIKQAVSIPYPAGDVLFVEKDTYEYTRYDLAGIIAWYVGEYVFGKQVICKALQHFPHDKRLQQNLQFYNEKI